MEPGRSAPLRITASRRASPGSPACAWLPRLLLGATATLYLRGELARYPFSLRIVFSTIAIGSRWPPLRRRLRNGRRLQALAWAQIVLDQLTWTAIVYVSGGATSGATSFYALTCLVGAILVGHRGAAVAAALGIGIYALLCAGVHFGWLPPPPDQDAAGVHARRARRSSTRSSQRAGRDGRGPARRLPRRALAPDGRRPAGGHGARARGRAARGARADRGGPGPRDPQSARLDHRLDRDAARIAGPLEEDRACATSCSERPGG